MGRRGLLRETLGRATHAAPALTVSSLLRAEAPPACLPLLGMSHGGGRWHAAWGRTVISPHAVPALFAAVRDEAVICLTNLG
jgi:hypothetical protein